MKIVVCVKTIHHLYTPMAWDSRRQDLDPNGAVWQVNPCDMTAVEAAVRIKEALPGTEVTIISIGSEQAEEGLRTCFAMGADRMVLASDPPESTPSPPWTTAAVLSHILSTKGFDLILCGKRSNDLDQGQVGLLVAEMLVISSISSLISLDPCSIGQGKVIASRALEGGFREEVEVELPCLFTIEESMFAPRYPRLSSVLDARNAPLERIDISGLTLPVNQPHLRRRGLILPRPKPKNMLTPESTLPPEDRLRQILGGGMSQKKTTRVDGSPKEMARKLFEWLNEKRILVNGKQKERSSRAPSI